MHLVKRVFGCRLAQRTVRVPVKYIKTLGYTVFIEQSARGEYLSAI